VKECWHDGGNNWLSVRQAAPGRVANTKEWFVTTPGVALLTDGKVNQAWEAKAPDFDTILSKIADSQEKGPFAENVRYRQLFLSTKQNAEAPERRRCL